MRTKALTILATLALLLSLPLAAQDPYGNEPTAAETEAEANLDANVDANAADADLDADLTTDDEVLPETASPLALIALLGVGGLASAAGLRRARRK